MFDFVLDFLATHYSELIALAVALLTAVVSYRFSLSRDNWGKVKRIVLVLVIEAEKYLGTGTGEQKKQQVIQWMYDRYPFINFFISSRMLSDLIEDVLRQLKESLAQHNADLDTLENNLLRKQ